MEKRKRIPFRIAAIAGALVAFVLALELLAPRIIDLRSVRERIQTALSREIGGSVSFERLDIAVFPRPCVKARLLRISLPGMAEGTIDSLNIYPRLLPLFTGDLRAAEIRADALDLLVRLPGKPAPAGKTKKHDTLAAAKNAIAAAGVRLASQAPNLAIVIQRGTVAVSSAGKPPIRVEEVEARIVFPPGEFLVSVDCSTPFWKKLSLHAALHPQTLAAEGSLVVESLTPQLLGPHLFPDGAFPVGDSLVDLDLSFTTDGATHVRATGAGSAPHLRFLRDKEVLLIERAQFKGSVELDEQKAVVTLDRLEAASPRLALKGSMQSSRTSPGVDVAVSGSDIDVKALRNAVLFFAPDNPTVQSIIAVLKAGMVPAMTFASNGKTLADLGDLDQMRITGTIQNGSIDIPGTPFRLTGVAGNTTISQGVLHGEQLTARFGNSSAHSGTVRLGLTGGDAPFHLDMMVNADLAELPPVLRTYVKDRSLVQELDMLREVTGVASGRLVLGESMRSIRVMADISSFSLHAGYQRVPLPLELRGGRFFFDQKNLVVEHMQGAIGKSSFTELSARMDLAAPSVLDITSAQFALALDQLHPWLATVAPIKEALKGIGTLRGAALLSVQHASVPLAGPGTVRFSAAGSVNNVTIGLSALPGPLTIAQGSFQADTQRISFANADASLLDASLNISGRLEGPLGSLQGGELTMTGSLGEQAVQWLSKRAGLPPDFAVRPPLSLSQTRVAWQGSDTVSCAGRLTIGKGPSVTFDVSRDSRRLAVNVLQIRDGDDQATINLMLEKNTLDLAFSGVVQERMLKDIFAGERFQQGRIAGNFQAHIPLDMPRQSTARGTLEGERLMIPRALKMPTVIDRISLKADGSRVTVGSADIRLGDTRLHTSGTITASAAGYLIDADLSADKADVDAIAAAVGEDKDRNAGVPARKSPPKSTWDLPLQGTVRFRAGSLRYRRLGAGPVRADITLGSNSIRAAIGEAALCGISLPGTMTVAPAGITLDLSPAAERGDMASSLACLGSKNRVTGTFSMKGRLTAKGGTKTILRSLQGKIEFTARDGLIHYDTVLVKALSFMSVNELLRGKLPDPTIAGIPYTIGVVKGSIKQGILHVAEYSIHGPVVDIAGQGDVDFDGKMLDLDVVLAPLTITTDVVRNIPGVNYILNGSLVTFPLHVVGPFDDVTVSYNPITSVGKGIFGILKRIVELPLKPFESDKNKD